MFNAQALLKICIFEYLWTVSSWQLQSCSTISTDLAYFSGKTAVCALTHSVTRIKKSTWNHSRDNTVLENGSENSCLRTCSLRKRDAAAAAATRKLTKCKDTWRIRLHPFWADQDLRTRWKTTSDNRCFSLLNISRHTHTHMQEARTEKRYSLQQHVNH